MYALPASVLDLVRDMGEFGHAERADFINAFVRDENLAMSEALKSRLADASIELMSVAANMIHVAHSFVEEASIHRVKVCCVWTFWHVRTWCELLEGFRPVLCVSCNLFIRVHIFSPGLHS